MALLDYKEYKDNLKKNVYKHIIYSNKKQYCKLHILTNDLLN